MKKLTGYIVTDYTDSDEIYVADRLLKEAKNCGVSLSIVKPQDCLLSKSDKKTVIFHKQLNGYEHLKQVDFAIVRSHDGFMKNEIIKLCKHVYNNQEKCDFYHNKFYQVNNLNNVDYSLKLVSSCLIPLQKYYNPHSLEKLYSNLRDSIGRPFVLKTLLGHGGQGVYLIHSKDEFLEFFKDENNLQQDFLAQQFVKESAGSDVRVFIIHGKPVAAMKRTSQTDDFRSNFSLGGSVENYTINKTITIIASELYKQTKLEIFGIDLFDISDQQLYYLCELNVNPGFEGIELATDINIAGNILQFILKDIKKKSK